jgi:hypothetical protein
VRYITGSVAAFLLALTQASSIEQFRLLGVTPNVVIVFLVAWLVVRGLEDVLPMLAIAGITLGLVGLQTPGLVLLALLPIAGLGVVREMHVVHSDLVLVVALVMAATLAYETVLLGAVMASGGGFDIAAAIRSAILPAIVVNCALAPFVYVVMRLARPLDRRGRLSY